MTETEMIVVRGEAAVRLVADPDDLAAVRRLLGPYLDCRVSGPVPEGAWTVFAGQPLAPPDSDRWPMFTQPAPDEPGVRVRHRIEQQMLVVDQDSDRWRCRYLARHTRNLLRRLYRPGQHAFLHAAAVADGGRGVLVLGGKRAGKTSTMLALLLTGPQPRSLVANDDASLTLGTDGRLRALGWPRSIGVRTDSATALDVWRPGLAERLGVDVNIADHERTAHYLDHWRVAEATGSDFAPECEPSLLVFPRFDRCAKGCTALLRPLSPAAAHHRLVTTGLQPADGYDTFLDTVLSPGLSDQVICSWWPAGEVPVPAVELVQCLHSLPHSGRLLWDVAARGTAAYPVPESI